MNLKDIRVGELYAICAHKMLPQERRAELVRAGEPWTEMWPKPPPRATVIPARVTSVSEETDVVSLRLSNGRRRRRESTTVLRPWAEEIKLRELEDLNTAKLALRHAEADQRFAVVCDALRDLGFINGADLDQEDTTYDFELRLVDDSSNTLVGQISLPLLEKLISLAHTNQRQTKGA